MKLSKKVLAAFSVAALLATSAVFTSCGEDDDDELGAISGSNNNYTLDFKNETGDTYRCYKTTTNKHRGALTQITMNKAADNGCALGYIWDLASMDGDDVNEDGSRKLSSKPRAFNLIGFNYNVNASNKVAYYVSRYADVWDIQAANFGVKDGVDVNGTTVKATEIPYIELNATNSFSPTIGEDGSFTVTVDVKEETTTGADNKTVYTGNYLVDIYNGAVTSAEINDGTAASKKIGATTTIPAAAMGYAENTRVAERSCAVYANVYQDKSAKATWHYADTYSAAEAVEE